MFFLFPFSSVDYSLRRKISSSHLKTKIDDVSHLTNFLVLVFLLLFTSPYLFGICGKEVSLCSTSFSHFLGLSRNVARLWLNITRTVYLQLTCTLFRHELSFLCSLSSPVFSSDHQPFLGPFSKQRKCANSKILVEHEVEEGTNYIM